MLLKSHYLLICLIVNTSILAQQKIKVYFNQSVDNSVSSITDAVSVSAIQDTIIKYINNANNSVDICNYNSSHSGIMTAINNAYLRGVHVRYIASKNVPLRNTQLSNLNPNIHLLQRSGGLPGFQEMHNKFIVIDQEDFNKATILTGSMNHTNNSLQNDFNNLIIIQHQELAAAYKTEFEEMWGSSTLIPDALNSKFGPDKTDNTQHIFNIDGIQVELYFSPSDNVSSKIKQKIQTANHSIAVAMLTFKDDSIADEIVLKQNAGINSTLLLHDDIGSSVFSYLSENGVETFMNNTSVVLHHKYALIDASQVDSDPIVISGSQNWNDNTEPTYDDNTLIIHDYVIAQQFLEEFTKRKAELSNSLSVENLENKLIVYPNPAEEMVYFSLPSNVQLVSLDGKILLDVKNVNSIDVRKITSGMYFLFFLDEQGTRVYYESILLK
jgi:phosphatidylserine/phosphatidylglycerophosphate/cardiolipin synthase-like enzyme